MIASEVPMQSCIRTSSGTPARRNASYSTGTMTAPPPMPNNPASNPVTTPAAITAAASSTSSVTGIPNINFATPRAGLVPGIHVFFLTIIAVPSRGWPGQARPRGGSYAELCLIVGAGLLGSRPTPQSLHSEREEMAVVETERHGQILVV